jgi:hypothetical protein
VPNKTRLTAINEDDNFELSKARWKEDGKLLPDEELAPWWKTKDTILASSFEKSEPEKSELKELLEEVIAKGGGVDEIMEAVNAYQRRLINPLEEVMAELRRNAPSQLNGFKRRF